jgi:hypothetical protein
LGFEGMLNELQELVKPWRYFYCLSAWP